MRKTLPLECSHHKQASHTVTDLWLAALATAHGWQFQCYTGTPAYGPLWANIKSSIKPQEEDWATTMHVASCIKNLGNIERVVPEIWLRSDKHTHTETDTRTNRHGHHNTSPPYPGRSKKTSASDSTDWLTLTDLVCCSFPVRCVWSMVVNINHIIKIS